MFVGACRCLSVFVGVWGRCGRRQGPVECVKVDRVRINPWFAEGLVCQKVMGPRLLLGGSFGGGAPWLPAGPCAMFGSGIVLGPRVVACCMGWEFCVKRGANVQLPRLRKRAPTTHAPPPSARFNLSDNPMGDAGIAALSPAFAHMNAYAQRRGARTRPRGSDGIWRWRVTSRRVRHQYLAGPLHRAGPYSGPRPIQLGPTAPPCSIQRGLQRPPAVYSAPPLHTARPAVYAAGPRCIKWGPAVFSGGGRCIQRPPPAHSEAPLYTAGGTRKGNMEVPIDP